MSPEQIASITNIVLIALFALLIVGFFSALLINYKRGIWSTTFRLFFIGTLVIVSICLLSKTAEIVGQFDLTILKINDINISRGEVTRTVVVTNLHDTIYNFVKTYEELYSIQGAAAINAYAHALADSVVMFVSFLVSIIAILIVGELLCLLLWHIVFKHFIPKLIRKRRKIKVASMIEGAVLYVVLAFMFFAPLTSLVSAVSKGYKKNNQGATDQYVQYVDKFVDTYESSLFAQVFLNWTSNDKGLTIDSQFMNAITTATYEDMEVGFVETVSELSSIASYFSNSFEIKDGEIYIDLSILKARDVMQSLFSTLKQSRFVSTLLPIAITVGLNLDVVAEYVDTSKIDFSQIESQTELSAIEDVYLNLLDSGLVDNFIDENGALINDIEAKNIVSSALSDASYDKVSAALAALDNSVLVSNLVPAVLYKLGPTTEIVIEDVGTYKLSDFVPSTADEMEGIKWGEELAHIFTCLHDAYAIDGKVLDILFDDVSTQSVMARPLPVKEENENQKFDDAIEMIAAHFDSYKKIIVGDVDANHNPTNVDETGKGTGENRSLLDSALLKKALNGGLKVVSDILGYKENAEDADNAKLRQDINVAISQLTDDKNTWRLNSKKELATALDIVGVFKDDYKLLFDISELLSRSFGDETTSEKDKADLKTFSTLLKQALPLVDETSLVSLIGYNEVLKILDTDMDDGRNVYDMFADFNLNGPLVRASLYDLRDQKQLGTEFAKLADLLVDIVEIKDIANLTDTNDILNLLAADAGNQALEHILNAFYDCKFLNPEAGLKYGDDLVAKKDENYFNFINYVFEKIEMEDKGLTFYHGNYDEFAERGADVNWKAANSGLALIIKEFANSEADGKTLMDVLQDENYLKDSSNLSKLLKSAEEGGFGLKQILLDMSKCEIFTQTLGEFLDLNIPFLPDLDIKVSFNNVTDWTAEIEKFVGIVEDIDKLNLDFDNIDLASVKDVVALNDLFHKLADSKIFVDRTDNSYHLSEWLLSKTIDSLTDIQVNDNHYDLARDPKGEFKDEWKLLEGHYSASEYPFRPGDKYENPDYLNYRLLINDFLLLDEYDDWYGEGYQTFDVTPYEKDGQKYYENDEFYDAYKSILKADEIGRLVNIVYYATKMLDEDIESITDLDSDIFSGLSNAVCESRCLRMGLYNICEIAKEELNNNEDVKEFFDFNAVYSLYLVNAGIDTSIGTDEFYKQSAVNRQAEADVLVDLYDLYHELSDKEIMKDDEFYIEKIDDEFSDHAREVFKEINSSQIFHRQGSALDKGDGKYYPSLFQSVMASFVTKTDFDTIFYDEDSPKDQYYKDNGTYVDASSKADVYMDRFFGKKATDEEQMKEIDCLFDTINIFIDKDGGIRDENGDISFDFENLYLKNDEIGKGNIAAIEAVLKEMNQSNLLRDCIGNAFNTAFSNEEIISMEGVDFKSADPYYYFKTVEGYNYDAEFDDDEIELVANLLNQYVELDDILQDLDDDASISDLDTIDKVLDGHTAKGSLIHKMVNNVYASKMLHQANKNIDNPSENTVFQSLIYQILTSDNFKEVYYSKDNPKDALYIDAEAKAMSEVNRLFGGASTKGQDEINGLFDIIDSVIGDKALKGEDGKATFDFSKVYLDKKSEDDLVAENNVTNLSNALREINKHELLLDLVPNIFNRAFNDEDTISMDGVDFTSANAFYYYGESFSEEFPEEEIDTIEHLLGNYVILNYKLNKIKEDDKDASLSDFDTIDKLLDGGAAKGSLINDLIDDIYASNMLHQENKNIKSIDENTVFQSIVYKILTNDDFKGVYYLSDGKQNPKDIYNGYSSADDKAKHELNRLFGYQVDGSSEINGLFAVMDSVIGDNGLKDENGDITFDFSKVYLDKKSETDEIAKENVANLTLALKEMNSHELLKDLVPNIFHKAFNNEDTVSMDGVDFTSANAFYYYGESFSEEFPEDEIDRMESLLNKYVDLNYKLNKIKEEKGEASLSDFDTIDEILEGGTATDSIIHKLVNDIYSSKMLHQANNYIDDAEHNTVFQSIIHNILTSEDFADIYFLKGENPKDDAYATVDAKAMSELNRLFGKGINGQPEIDGLFAVMDNLIGEHSVKDKDGKTTFDFTTIYLDKTSDEDHIAENNVDTLIATLKEMNGHELLKDLVPNIFHKAFTGDSISLEGVDFKSANAFYHYGESYSEEFPEEEIDTIESLLDNYIIVNYNFDGGDMTDMSTLQSVLNGKKLKESEIYDLVNDIYDSEMLHNSNKNITVENKNTVFQSIIFKILTESGFKSIYYLDDNPKDQKNIADGLYDGVTVEEKTESKAYYDLNRIFNKNSTTGKGELDKFFDVLACLVGDNGLKDGDGKSVYDLSKVYLKNDEYGKNNIDVLTDTLYKMLDTELLYDAVPNAFHKSFNDEDTISMDGVDFKSANAFYKYDLAGYNAKMDTEEINTVHDMLFDYVELDEKIGDDSLSDFDTVKKVLDNKSIKESNIYSLMLHIRKSNMLHVHDKNIAKADANTVFQSIFHSLLTDSDLKDVFYYTDSVKDKAKVGDYTNAETKSYYVLNSLFNNAVTSENQIKEIDAFCDVIDQMLLYTPLKDKDNKDSYDFSNLYLEGAIGKSNVNAIEQAFLKMNDSKLLFDAVPNSYHKAFNDGQIEMKGVDFTSANAYYHYYLGSEPNYNEQFEEEEIERMSAILTDYVDLNDQLAEKELTELSTIEELIESTEHKKLSETYVYKMVEKILHSNMLHVKNLNIADGSNNTVYQGIVYNLLTDTGLKGVFYNIEISGLEKSGSEKDIYYYDSDKYSSVETKALYVLNQQFGSAVSMSKQEDEFEKFFNVIDVAVGPEYRLKKVDGEDKVVSSYDFSDIYLEDNPTGHHNVASMEAIMKAMNDSAVLFDAVPNAYYKAFNENTVEVDGIDFKTANAYYHYYKDSLVNYEARFDEYEIEKMSELLNNYIELKGDLTDEFGAGRNASDLNVLRDAMKKKGLSNITETSLYKLIVNLYESEMLHKSNKNISKADGFTVFQGVMNRFLIESGLKEVYFHVASTKDQHYVGLGTYSDLASKSSYQINSMFDAYEFESAKELAQKEDIYDFFYSIDAMVGNDYYLRDNTGEISYEFEDIYFGDDEYGRGNVEALGEILKRMRNSDLLADAVPNAFYRAFNDGTVAVDGIDFTSADPYYFYTPAYTEVFEEDEIDNVIDLLRDYVQYNGIVSTKGGISDFDAIKDVVGIDDETINNNLAYSMLYNMYKSEMLHGHNHNINDDDKLTVFEGMMNMLVDKSGLASMTYAKVGSDYPELIANIKAMSKVDRGQVAKTLSHDKWFATNLVKTDDKYNEEVASLIDFLRKGINVTENLLSSGSMDMNSVDYGKLSPNATKTIMYAANRVDYIHDTVPSFVSRGFEAVKFDELLTHKGTLYAQYDQTQAQYENYEINRIYTVLDSFAEKDGEGNFVSYVETTNATALADKTGAIAAIFHFIDESAIFSMTGEDDGLSFDAKGLFVYNTLNKVDYDVKKMADNFTGNSVAEKLHVASLIFEFDDADMDVEANAMESLVKDTNLKQITEKAGDFDYIKDNLGDTIENLMKSCYQGGRAYILSDVVSNVLDDFLNNENDNIQTLGYFYKETTFGPHDYQTNKDQYKNYQGYTTSSSSADYITMPINDTETNAITNALKTKDVCMRLAALTGSVTPEEKIEAQNAANEAKDVFSKMGTSYTARTLYLSRGHEHLMGSPIDSLKFAIKTAVGEDGSGIYADGFNFSNIGTVVYDALAFIYGF